MCAVPYEHEAGPHHRYHQQHHEIAPREQAVQGSSSQPVHFFFMYLSQCTIGVCKKKNLDKNKLKNDILKKDQGKLLSFTKDRDAANDIFYTAINNLEN